MSARRFDRELGALREELAAARARPRPAPSPPPQEPTASTPAEAADLAQFEAQVQELAEAIEGYMAQAGEAAATRPLVLIGTAFLAGVVAGHGLRRG